MRSIRTLMFRGLADASRDEFIGYLLKNIQIFGAGDGVRTRDPELGKLVLYQLSYTRIIGSVSADTATAKNLIAPCCLCRHT